MIAFEDWLAITATKARYCRCLDTKDWNGYADCFTQDLVLTVPPYDDAGRGTEHRGRDEAIAYVRSCVEASVTVHHVHNPEVTLCGPDEARVV